MVERRKARDVPTVKELFDRWLETYAKHHRKTWKDDQRQFNKYLPDFHGRRLNAVQTSEVAGWHTRAGEEYGHYQANRAIELLRTLYNRTKEVMGFECPNPCASVRPFKEEPRDRFLQAEELRPFFDAVNQEEPAYRDFFMLALWTGALFQRASDGMERRTLAGPDMEDSRDKGRGPRCYPAVRAGNGDPETSVRRPQR